MLHLLIKILRLFIKPQNNFIIYHSFPDVSDNSFSLFCYIINNQKEFKNIWLVNDNEIHKFHRTIANYTNSKNYKIYQKKSFSGIYYYCKSKFIFHTHGIFNNIPLSKKQININLWHGMPLKNIGHLDNNKTVPTSNYVIATSKLFQKIMSQAFSVKLENVLITGQPRNDFIFTDNYSLLDVIDCEKNSFEKTVLWMPTYRKSIVGDVRIDGELTKMNDFLEESFLMKLNAFFAGVKTACFIKLHPMDFMEVKNFKKYSNLFFLNNKHFEKKGIPLYAVLNNTDLLLTDFSSIYIDYLLLDKPMAFLVSDFHQYSNSRGFVFDNPKEVMPGEIITNNGELVSFLKLFFTERKDVFQQERIKVKQLFHDQNNKFSEHVFNKIIKNNV